MAVQSRSDVYRMAKEAGATAEEATLLTVIAELESGFNDSVKNPSSSATGLFQFLKGHVGAGQTDWRTNPVISTQRALSLLRTGRGGVRQLGSAGAGHWEALTLAGDGNRAWQDKYETALVEAYRTAAAFGDAPVATSLDSLSGLDGSGAATQAAEAGAAPGGVAQTSQSTQATVASDSVPDGYDIYTVDGETYVAYTIGSDAANVTLYYRHEGAPLGGPSTSLSQSAWKEKVAGAGFIEAGTTAAFEESGDYAGLTYQERYESVLWEMGLYGTDAMQDQSVMEVIGLMLSRPDMEPTEFSNRLSQTDWARAKTDLEKAWNDKSPAQQELEILEKAGEIAGLMFTYMGQDVDLSGASSLDALAALYPKVHEHATALASGATTQQMIINDWIKGEARKDSESPWMRRVRDEEAARGEHSTDIDTQAKAVQDLYYEYGIPITVAESREFGERLVMNQTSFMEVQETVRDQAEALYPNKPRQVATRTWAQPYASTMASLWEVSDQVDLQDKHLQKALQTGASLGDFRKALKSDERWLDTKNAKDEMNGIISELGTRMGY